MINIKIFFICVLLSLLLACGNGGSDPNDGSVEGDSSITPQTLRKTIQFSTSDQGLFGPGDPIRVSSFPAMKLHEESIGPETKGRIYENVSQEVPLSILQSAWDQALSTCRTSRSVKAVDYCEAYTYTPTQSQCETGQVRLPANVSINCCTYLGIIDTNVSYPACAGGILDGKKDYTRAVPENLRDINLGAGIGSRPTQPANKPFDVGVITNYQVDIDAGLELLMTTDAGSVDVGYATEVNVMIDDTETAAGETFTLQARHMPIEDDSLSYINSAYPNINFAFQYYVDVLARLSAEYAHMGSDGKQKRATEMIVNYATANLPDADVDGRLVGEIIGLEVGVSGAEVRIFADQPSSFPADFPGGIVWDFPLSFSWDITSPFTCPIAGIPKVGTYFCGPPPPISTDIVELNIRTPSLNTPADPDFDGGVQDFASLTPLTPLRQTINTQGHIINTTPSGYRELLSVPGLGGFSSLDDILLDDGRLSTDWLRLDLDIDGLLSLHNGGANPLGGNFVFGGETIDPKTGKNKAVANMEWNLVDFDFANWFHVDQILEFKPKLVVSLVFNPAVEVRESNSEPFTLVSEYTLAIEPDKNSQLEIIQPAGGVSITPTYSLKNNRFSNQANMLWTSAIQESMLQVKVQGLMADLLASALLPIGDDLNFAVAQTTFANAPLVVGKIADTEFSLAGFVDVNGQTITTSEP